MLSTLVTFIVRLTDLVEAEARSAKENAIRLSIAMGMAWAAVVLLLGAFGVFAAAIAVALSYVMPAAWALAIVGLLLLLIAAVFGLVARWVFERKKRTPQ